MVLIIYIFKSNIETYYREEKEGDISEEELN